jgi:hypothetical protein
MGYDLTTDSAGNAILTWPNTTDFTVHAQQFNAQGVANWGSSGMLISSAGAQGFAPQSLSFTNGATAIAWLDQTTTNPATNNVCVINLNSNGLPVWSTPFSVPIPLHSAGTAPQLVPGAGTSGKSVIVVWVENTAFNAPGDIYAQRINGLGAPVWASKVKLNGASQLPYHMSPAVVSDGIGGLYLTWTTDLGGNHFAGLVQHLNLNGGLDWASNGVPVSTSTTTLQLAQAITYLPGQKQVVVAWKETDSSQGVSGINAQAFDAQANPLWPGTGLVIVGTAPDVTGIVGALRPAANGAALFFSEDKGYGQRTEYVALLLAQAGATPITTNLSSIGSDKLHLNVSNPVNGGFWSVWDDDRGGIFGAFWKPQ